jgi:hypothetical protein
MRSLLAAALLVLVVLAEPLAAQATVPGANLVVLRRNQTYGSAVFSWSLLQDGATVQTFTSSPFVVPAGKRLVVTGIRYHLLGTHGGTLTIGPSVSANVYMYYYTRAVVEPAGTQTTIERSEHFTNGIAFPAGTLVDLRLAKVSSGSLDTVVWCFLYGYLE